MPNEHINKVEIYRNSSTQTLIDITDTTATASDVAQGKYFYLASGERVAGTSSGGSGDGYILTTIVPQTTFTPNSSRIYSLSSVATGRLYDGESYLVTLDGTQYLTTCGIEWSTNYIIGEDNIFFSTNDHVYPFAIGWVSAQEFEICVLDAQQHTVKVEHIELVSPTVLTTKTITTNGTYNASGDNATGYSSVTVNVSGGGGGGGITQDQDGYLVLSPDGGGGSVTVEPLSVTQNGTYTASSGTAYSPVTVNVSGGGGGDSGYMSDPIRFFDYDGTLVASYTSVPSSLPSVPTHTGLTSGTWNHTLQQITTQFNAVGTCDVGANYETSSGKTEIDCAFVAGRLIPCLRIAVNGTVTVDWGDNSTTTVTGTSLTSGMNRSHQYSQAGSYTITIEPASGTTYSLCCTSGYTLLNGATSTLNLNHVYASCVAAVRVGAGCSIVDYSFAYCCSLQSVSIPSGVTSIGNNTFQQCYSLRHFSIPSGVTSVGSSTFSQCQALRSVSIPSGVTSIGSNVFYNCRSLATLTFGSSLASIGASAFSGCYGAIAYHFTSTTVPTLENTNAFTNSLQSTCKIYVPSAKLTDYQTANNWSTYASKIVGE